MMRITGDDIVGAARSWIGTPFHHQARLKGHGVDCVGLVVGVAMDLGLVVRDRRDYSRLPDGFSLEAELEDQLVQVPDRAPGDVLMFRMPRLPRHVGIYAGTDHEGTPRMIHATSNAGKCVEVNLDTVWLRALKKTYRFRELG
jgi:cell wall-associated NlpC family hydrolase